MKLFHLLHEQWGLFKLRRMGVLNKGTSIESRDRKKRFRDAVGNSVSLKGVFLFLLFAGLLFSFLKHPEMLEVPDLSVGKPAYAAVFALMDLEIPDYPKTDAARQQVRSKIPIFFCTDEDEQKKLLQDFDGFITLLKKQNASGSAKKTESEEALPGSVFQAVRSLCGNESGVAFLREALMKAAERGYISEKEHKEDSDAAVQVIGPVSVKQDLPLTRGELPWAGQVAEKIAAEYARTYLVEKKRNEFIMGLTYVLQPMLNSHAMQQDLQHTETMRHLAASRVKNVMRNIVCGEKLVELKEIVTPEKKSLLDAYSQALNENRDRLYSAENILKSTVVSLILLLFFYLMLSSLLPDIWNENWKLCMISLVILLSVLLNMIFTASFYYFSKQFSLPLWLLFMALPLGIAPMTVTPSLGKKAGIIAGFFTSIAASLALKDSGRIFFTGLMLSVFVPYMVHSCKNYRDFLLTGFLTMFLVTLPGGFILIWLSDIPIQEITSRVLLVPFLSVFLGTALVQAMLYGMDFLFDAATDMSLRLLLTGDHPLLRKLQIEAPGSYHHSLMVSLLAEKAAELTGGNSMLARVGALFHDIGKLRHPEYFTENGSSEDKHRELSPKSSALFIISHVRNGVELAQKYKLKHQIVEIIEQHHGTDAIRYFLHTAAESGEEYDENDFHYKGPLPQTKEAAVVLLADACEAAARSLDKPTHNRIGELVDSIVTTRLEEGQLNDSNLTFRDLSVIRECFTKMLTSMHHARVAYPSKKEEEKNPSHESELLMADGQK